MAGGPCGRHRFGDEVNAPSDQPVEGVPEQKRKKHGKQEPYENIAMSDVSELVQNDMTHESRAVFADDSCREDHAMPKQSPAKGTSRQSRHQDANGLAR